jgi:5-methylcytosine-specific restriction endonuclease McrA
MTNAIKVGMKKCSNPECREKPLSAFGSYSNSKDGKQGYCRECRQKYNREYRTSPKGRAVRTLSKTRYERRKAEIELGHAIEDTLTSHQIAMVLAEDRCLYCGHLVEYGKMTVDHVKTFRNGGTNTYDNILPSCKGCNSRKGDRPILEFLRKYATPMQLKRTIFRLAQRQNKGYFEMWSELNEEVSSSG